MSTNVAEAQKDDTKNGGAPQVIEEVGSYNTEYRETLIGRDAVWQALQHTPQRPVGTRHILYLWGPAGCGKSYLLQRFFESMMDWEGEVIFTDGLMDNQYEMSGSRHGQHGWPRIMMQVEAVKDKERLLWIVDNYDAVQDLWPVISGVRRAGGCVILSGRQSPRRLWPGEQSGQIVSHRLTDFDVDTARQLCAQLDVHDPAVVEEAIAISRGRPRLLCMMMDSIKLVAEAWPGDSAVACGVMTGGMTSFLLEQVCHPGSQRMAWRAGQGNDKDVDALIAVSSMTPIFNRHLLAEVLGHQAVAASWDALTAMPFVDAYQGGYYGMPALVRARVKRAAQASRPWMWEQWTRKLAAYHLHHALHKQATTSEEFWDRIMPLVRMKVGKPLFDRSDEFTWSWGRLSELPSASYDAAQVSYAQAEVLTAFHQDGTAAGYVVIDRRSHDQLLIIHDLQVPDHDGLTEQTVFGALLRVFPPQGKVLWTVRETSPAMSQVLNHLGFGLPMNPKNATPSRMLDLATMGYHAWLADILRAPVAPPPEHPIPAIQEALQLLSSEPDLERTVLAQYWRQVGVPDQLRAWFLDALTSADLGAHIGGKTLLALYYLDKQGTHEELAERLHLSRATYFRNHRAALERLAQALFE
ncbi:MAG: hypothetical protein C7B44_07310 [Sulfobacillus thermosulfidooxidans]|nr:MAG: hypothetical protein C7B44_07310 [Sulfobacillus thermosulfidooxidans]